jgi:glucose-6-phosphate isomerase
MSYVHLASTCFSEALGTHGLDRAVYDSLIVRAAEALEGLRARHADGSLPLLRLPAARDDLAALKPVAEDYRARFAEVVVLGTGGSSLGGRTLCRLSEDASAPRLRFEDNVDPHSFDALLKEIDPAKTGFIVISKSGSTAETMTQFLVCLAAMRAALGDGAAAHFTAITEPGDSVLRRLCAKFGIDVLDHDPGVGGRYSALSLVGLLPAMIAGLDAAAVRAGAQGVLDLALGADDPETVPPAVGAAIAVGLAREKRISQSVLMPYVDRLREFALWYRQLWAESLGKRGQGTTPVDALGTVDQHSQLQLYLDGPRDKMFTVMMLACAGTGARIDPALADDDALGYLAGRTVGDLMDAEQRATARTLIRNNRPTRIFRLETLDEATMGALMMHFMLETVIAAHLLQVDPFDQPAVEEGKVLTREYLAEVAREAGGG